MRDHGEVEQSWMELLLAAQCVARTLKEFELATTGMEVCIFHSETV